MTPIAQHNAAAKLITADVMDGLASLPGGSVHCAVTSPPYFGLRDYQTAGQIGHEATPQAYIERLVAVFREVRRVLRDDGTLWLNLGDSYAQSEVRHRNGKGGSVKEGTYQTATHQTGRKLTPGTAAKQLLGIPWRVALALQADGWILRSDIVWAKPNPMPESVRDRPTKAHEYLFLLAKQPRYFYDAEAVKETAVKGAAGSRFDAGKTVKDAVQQGYRDTESRNLRSVWHVATQPYKGAHFATFPPKLIEPCVKAGTSERGCCPTCGAPWHRVTERTRRPTRPGTAADYKTPDPERHVTEVKTLGWRQSCKCEPADPVPCTVLDPFSGAATAGLVALKLGRRYVGVEINPDYVSLSRDRLQPFPVEVVTHAHTA